MGDSLYTYIANQQSLERKRAEDWHKAVARLSITFEAEHGGGYPDCLKDMTPKQRMNTLRGLGYRLMERYEIDVSAPGQPPDYQPWARITGRITVNLADGWVCREVDV